MNRKLLLLVLMVAACDAPTVPETLLEGAYDFRLLTPSPQVMHWDLGRTVRVFAAADADPSRAQILEAAVAHAVSAWNGATLYGEIGLAAAQSVEDADVVVEFSDSDSPLDLSGCQPSGTLAYTTFCLNNSGTGLIEYPLASGAASQVKFVVTVRSGAGAGESLITRLVTHEMGHVLGIGQHSIRETDLMYGGTLTRDDPGPADRATLQLLYHTKETISAH